MNEYKNKKVLVTGGTGLIGRQVVDLLVEYGANVTSLSLDNTDRFNQIQTRAVFLNVDLRAFGLCLRYTENQDFVFHLAGIKASPDITNKHPSTMSIPALQINTNVLEACRVNKMPKVLFTSSIGAYSKDVILTEENAYKGEPMDFYPGMVKRMAEYQIQAYQEEFGLNWCIVRLTNNMGIGDNFNPDNGMFVSSLMAKILRGDNPVEIWGDGLNVRDFAYSKDTARGILHMMLNHKDTQPINLGGIKASVKEVVQMMQSIIPFEAHYNPQKNSGIKERVLDSTKAQSLGYTHTTTLYDALKETWGWYKNNSQEYLKRQNYFNGK